MLEEASHPQFHVERRRWNVLGHGREGSGHCEDCLSILKFSAITADRWISSSFAGELVSRRDRLYAADKAQVSSHSARSGEIAVTRVDVQGKTKRGRAELPG